MGQKRQVQRDGSKETDPNRRVQITGPRRQNGPNIAKLVHYGPKSNQKMSKWVRHNQVSWSSSNGVGLGEVKIFWRKIVFESISNNVVCKNSPGNARSVNN